MSKMRPKLAHSPLLSKLALQLSSILLEGLDTRQHAGVVLAVLCAAHLMLLMLLTQSCL